MEKLTKKSKKKIKTQIVCVRPIQTHQNLDRLNRLKQKAVQNPMIRDRKVKSAKFNNNFGFCLTFDLRLALRDLYFFPNLFFDAPDFF